MAPMMITRGAASAKGFGFTAGSAPIVYWIATLKSGSANSSGSGIVTDSSKNVYAVGIDYTYTAPVLAKYDSSGNILWKYRLSSSTGTSIISLALDSSQQPIIYNGSSTPQIIKFDTSGNILWQYTVNPGTYSWLPTNSLYGGQLISVDSSDNIYTVQYAQDPCSVTGIIVIKRNSSGARIWSTSIPTANVSSTAYRTLGISLDLSSQPLIAASFTRVNADAGTLVSLDTSGYVLQSMYAQGSSCCGVYPPCEFYSSAVDSAGNFYAVGRYKEFGASNYYILTIKYNSSGTKQWAQLVAVSTQAWGADIVIDSSNNIYVVATGYTVGYVAIILKYNSSGTLQWQRSITGPIEACTQTLVYGSNISIIDNKYINVECMAKNYGVTYGEFLTLQLPTDGSKTGTYSIGGQSFVYAASSGTVTTPSTMSNGSAGRTTIGLGTISDSASSYTTSNSVMVASKATL